MCLREEDSQLLLEEQGSHRVLAAVGSQVEEGIQQQEGNPGMIGEEKSDSVCECVSHR